MAEAQGIQETTDCNRGQALRKVCFPEGISATESNFLQSKGSAYGSSANMELLSEMTCDQPKS